MKIADDKAARFGKKIFWWGIMLFILLALYQCADKMIAQFFQKTSDTPQGYMEGDLWIDKGSAVVKPKMETKTVRAEMAGGRDVEITTNCREMYEYIATLEPGESIQIRHIDFGPDFPKRNRCSYSANGASIPIYGEPGKVTRPRFRHDLPFPDMPHGVMVFLLQGTSGRIIAHDYIKEAGGIIYIDNPLPEKVEAHLQYNFMQALLTDKLMKEQVGWDGSTAKFHATRFQTEPWPE